MTRGSILLAMLVAAAGPGAESATVPAVAAVERAGLGRPFAEAFAHELARLGAATAALPVDDERRWRAWRSGTAAAMRLAEPLRAKGLGRGFAFLVAWPEPSPAAAGPFLDPAQLAQVRAAVQAAGAARVDELMPGAPEGRRAELRTAVSRSASAAVAAVAERIARLGGDPLFPIFRGRADAALIERWIAESAPRVWRVVGGSGAPIPPAEALAACAAVLPRELLFDLVYLRVEGRRAEAFAGQRNDYQVGYDGQEWSEPWPVLLGVVSRRWDP